MSKECKQARNIVSTAFVLMMALVAILSMSSCGTTGNCGGWKANSSWASCPAYR